jgi:acyl-CoA thioesterase-1
MIEMARAANILPIVSTIQHVNVPRVLQRHAAPACGQDGPNRRMINSTLVFEDSHKRSVILADFNSAFGKAGGPTIDRRTDGVHLTAEGYALVARTFFDVLPKI